jgi:hypothetical protein
LAYCWPGVGGRTNALTTDTIVAGDRGTIVTETNAGAIAVSIPQAGTTNFANNFYVGIRVPTASGTVTITPTAGQIAGNNGVLGATLAVAPTSTAYCYSFDNLNYQCVVVASGGGSGFPPCVTTTGAVNAMVATYSPAITPALGTLICFQPNNNNTIAAPTINVNGFGAKTITRLGASTLNTAPADLLTGVYYYAVYDGSTNFQLVNFSSQVALTSGTTNCVVSYNGGVSPATLSDANICLSGGGQWKFGGVGIVTSNGAFISGGGASPPACVISGTPGTACFAEGAAPTAAAAVDDIWSDSTLHDWATHANGGGKRLNVNIAPNPVHAPAQTAAITTATLCAAAAGACNQAGNYTIEWAFTQVGTACGTPGTGGVTFLLTWTDQNGTVHSAIQLAMDDSASLVATTGTFHFTTSNATAWASGQFNLSSNGSIIQYATGYVACSVGTGSYQLDAWATRKE